MALENVISQEIVQKLGWTLLHFVWQAAAVALLLGILLALLKKSPANLRYIVACTALGLIVLLPIATLQLIQVSTLQPPANVKPAPAFVVLPVEPVEETPLGRALEYMEMAQPENVETEPTTHWKQRTTELLDSILPHIVSAWLLGVFGLSLWHLGGWAQLQRFKKQMVKRIDVSLQVKLNELSGRLRVKQAVQLLESARVQVPIVVGWLRPVILLPASALTGLTADQLEALLAHELAHIRRYDYLVNMLQTVVETLGFYHPAVWWISHKIRVERENCCDDLAISISGDRIHYVKALTSMEEIRSANIELAITAAGGNLFSRIRRLIGKNSTEKAFSWIPAVTVILLLVALIIPTTLALTTKEKHPTAEFITDKSENGQPEKALPNTEKIDSSTKILIETQIVHVNNEFLEQVGLDAASLKNSNTWTQYRVDNSSKPSMFAIDSSKKDMLLKTIDESGDSSAISRIFLMTMSGQEAMIKNNSSYDFRSQELGRFIKVKPELSQDGKNVNVNCELMMRQFKNLDLFFDVYSNKKVDQNDVSESEIVEYRRNAGNAPLFDDQTLLILGGKLVSLQDVENGTPILRNIPVIGELFNTTSKVKVEKNEIILIKTSIATPQQSDDVDSKASSDNVFKIVDPKANELLRIYLDLNLLEAGQYVEIKNSGQRESILLKQVATSDIGKHVEDFPAYACYIDFEIRSNFDLNLATKRYTRGSFSEHDKWDAYFTGPNTIIGNGNFSTTTLCVCMWRVKLYKMGRADDNQASLVAVIIKPSNKPQEKSDEEVENNDGRIEGRIIDINTGKGISGVQLVVVPDASLNLDDRFTCTSGEDGTFTIGGLKSGEYLLQGDFPSVDVDVISGRSTSDVLIGIRRGETVPAPKETTIEQQSDGQILIGIRLIRMPADAMKEAFGPNENFSSGLLVRQSHEIAGRLLTLSQKLKDAKQLVAPQMLLNNNSNGTIAIIKEEFFIHHYEPNENEPGKLDPQLQPLDVGWRFKIFAEILGGGEKVHIKLAAKQQQPGFETRQYRPGYDYQIPSPLEIFAIELTAKNGEPVIIGRLSRDENAYCLIVTPSAILPELQPEPLLGKKLPEPDNIQNIDSIKQAEGKQILVCFWDMNQRPSRNLVGELAKREKELAGKNVAVYLVQTSNIESAKLKEWLDNSEIPFICGSIKDNVNDVLFRWGVQAQPWLILTDEKGIVRAEGFDTEQLDEKLQEASEPTAVRTRIVHFPDDRTVGKLKIRDTRPDIDWDRGYLSLPGWALLGPAQGDVSVPAGEDLRLEVSGDVTDFSFLSDLKPNNLQVLILSNKKISDEDLIHLKGLTGLLALSLDTTPIEDAGLAHLAALTSLKDLSLFNTKVSDAGLEHLSSLKSLKHLSLFITQVRGPGLKCLQNLTSLILLDLAATPITDESLVHVAEITWLKELQLQDTYITNKGLAHLKSLRSLEMLILGNTNLKQGYSPITDDGLVYLEGLDSLRDLHLLRTRVTDAGLAHLSNLKTLEYLDLKETRLTGEGLAYLKDLPALTYLNLEKTGVTEVGLKYLKEMSNLHVLLLDGENINEKDLKDLEKALPDCMITIRIANSANRIPEVSVLSKSTAPLAEDKSIVKVDLAWVEVPAGSQVDRETIAEIRNLLESKIIIPESPPVADLLRNASKATEPVKDESAGGKRVTQQQIKTLFDLLVSRGYVKILMNPTLEVVDGQTAQIKDEQNLLEVTANAVKDDIIYLTVKTDLSSQIAPANEGQKPIISTRSFANFVSISSGQSQILGGMVKMPVRSDEENNDKAALTPAGELLCIVTASIVAPSTDAKQQDQATVDKEYEVIQLSHINANEAAERITKAFSQLPRREFLPSILVQPIENTGQIIIFGKPDIREKIKKFLAEIDALAPPSYMPVTRVYDIYDLVIARAIISRGAVDVTMDGSDGMMGRNLNIPDQAIVNEARNIVNLIMQTIEPNGWFQNNPNATGIITPFPDVRPRKLAIYQSLHVHQQIEKFLKSQREQIDKTQISIALRYLYTNVEFLNEVRDSMGIEFKPDTFLDDIQLGALLRASQKKRNIKSLMAPVATVLNNQTARFSIARHIFMSFLGYSEPDNLSQQSPPVPTNMFCRIKPHIEDNKDIIIDFVQDIPGLQERIIYDRREKVQSYTETTAITNKRIPNNKTLAFSCDIRKVDQDNQIVSSAEKKILIVLIKPTIIVQEEMPRREAATMILKSPHSKDNTEEQSVIDKDKIQIDTKILTASDEFMRYIGLDPNSVASSEGWADYLVHSTDDSASFIIDQLHIDLLCRNVTAHMQTHKDIRMLQKPQVLALSGKKVEIHILDSEYYILIAPNEPNSSSKESESKSHRIELGTTIRLTPTLTPDGENIELDFEWEYRRLRGIKEHTGPEGKVQKVPQIDVDSIKTPCTIPDGKTLLIAGKKITEQKKKEARKPQLGDLPLIGRLFYSPPQPEETKNLIIMIKPSTDIKAPPLPPPIDPNDPLIKKLEEKFKRYDERKIDKRDALLFSIEKSEFYSCDT